MRRFSLFLWIAAQAFAQKKPITLDTLDEVRHGGRGGAVDWAPDGKSFVFREQKMLKIYDPASKSSKDLVSTEAMDNAAVKPDDTGPFDWINRRAHDGGLEWSGSSNELVYSSGGDIFLIHAGTGKWEQLTKTPEAEHDPKFSPDGKSIAFRRESDLYVMDLETRQEIRLTRNGTPTLINGGLDWVYPEESKSEPHSGGLPTRNRSRICNSTPAASRFIHTKTLCILARSMSRSAIRKPARTMPTSIWAWSRPAAARRDGWMSAILAMPI